LPGGVRIVDASGPDDDVIEWGGRFRGGTAMSRALAVDGMRRAEQQVSLQVLGLSYNVFIRSFSWHPGRGGLEIGYEISLHVLVDNTQGGGFFATVAIDVLVKNDMQAALAALARTT
jgi:hypothetical protein